MKKMTGKKNAHHAIIIAQIVCSFIVSIWVCRWSSSLENNIDMYTEYIDCSESRDMIVDNMTIKIRTVDDWLSFTDKVNDGKSSRGYSVCLMSDLDFSQWEHIHPVGNSTNPFEGTFMGNGHKIKNMKIVSTEDYVGLFGVAKDASINGIILENCDIKSDSATGTGGIVGLICNGEISHCTFKGRVIAEEGSVGGIAGNNWAEIKNCSSYGSIVGDTWSGTYSYNGVSNSYGNGGIAGDSGNSVFRCVNYASVSDDSEEHESNTNRSGGIVGYNTSWIESCTNYGGIAGGGIAETNGKYSTIRGCFNFGSAYAGITDASFKDSFIEHCINLGEVSGRYSADIASFWGISSENNVDGKITQCLYVNSSNTGAACRNYMGKKSLVNNYKIGKLGQSDRKTVINNLNKNEYSKAYSYIVDVEIHKRYFLCRIVLITLFLFVLVHIILYFESAERKKRKLYQVGKDFFSKNEYLSAYEIFCENIEYKNSAEFASKSLLRHLTDCRESGIYRLGRIDDVFLEWNVLKEEQGEVYLLSKYALAVGQINPQAPVVWEKSELYQRLNTDYKNIWFGETLSKDLDIEISMLSVEEAGTLLKDAAQRQCKPIYRFENVLMNSVNVYWWLKNEKSVEASKMPFVTAEGLISEKGQFVTACNIAIRPVIRMRIPYEEDL